MTPERLKQIRAALGLWQYQMARQLAVSPSRISEWENGKRDIPEYIAEAIRQLWGHIQPVEPESVPTITPDKIKAIRKRYGLRRRQFGVVIGRSESAVALYEQGKRTPPVEVVKKILDLDK